MTFIFIDTSPSIVICSLVIFYVLTRTIFWIDKKFDHLSSSFEKYLIGRLEKKNEDKKRKCLKTKDVGSKSLDSFDTDLSKIQRTIFGSKCNDTQMKKDLPFGFGNNRNRKYDYLKYKIYYDKEKKHNYKYYGRYWKIYQLHKCIHNYINTNSDSTPDINNQTNFDKNLNESISKSVIIKNNNNSGHNINAELLIKKDSTTDTNIYYLGIKNDLEENLLKSYESLSVLINNGNTSEKRYKLKTVPSDEILKSNGKMMSMVRIFAIEQILNINVINLRNQSPISNNKYYKTFSVIHLIKTYSPLFTESEKKEFLNSFITSGIKKRLNNRRSNNKKLIKKKSLNNNSISLCRGHAKLEKLLKLLNYKLKYIAYMEIYKDFSYKNKNNFLVFWDILRNIKFYLIRRKFYSYSDRNLKISYIKEFINRNENYHRTDLLKFNRKICKKSVASRRYSLPNMNGTINKEKYPIFRYASNESLKRFVRKSRKNKNINSTKSDLRSGRVKNVIDNNTKINKESNATNIQNTKCIDENQIQERIRGLYSAEQKVTIEDSNAPTKILSSNNAVINNNNNNKSNEYNKPIRSYKSSINFNKQEIPKFSELNKIISLPLIIKLQNPGNFGIKMIELQERIKKSKAIKNPIRSTITDYVIINKTKNNTKKNQNNEKITSSNKLYDTITDSNIININNYKIESGKLEQIFKNPNFNNKEGKKKCYEDQHQDRGQVQGRCIEFISSIDVLSSKEEEIENINKPPNNTKYFDEENIKKLKILKDNEKIVDNDKNDEELTSMPNMKFLNCGDGNFQRKEVYVTQFCSNIDYDDPNIIKTKNIRHLFKKVDNYDGDGADNDDKFYEKGNINKLILVKDNGLIKLKENTYYNDNNDDNRPKSPVKKINVITKRRITNIPYSKEIKRNNRSKKDEINFHGNIPYIPKINYLLKNTKEYLDNYYAGKSQIPIRDKKQISSGDVRSKYEINNEKENINRLDKDIFCTEKNNSVSAKELKQTLVINKEVTKNDNNRQSGTSKERERFIGDINIDNVLKKIEERCRYFQNLNDDEICLEKLLLNKYKNKLKKCRENFQKSCQFFSYEYEKWPNIEVFETNKILKLKSDKNKSHNENNNDFNLQIKKRYSSNSKEIIKNKSFTIIGQSKIINKNNNRINDDWFLREVCNVDLPDNVFVINQNVKRKYIQKRKTPLQEYLKGYTFQEDVLRMSKDKNQQISIFPALIE